ncbi:hypothetical protein BpHYR1_005419 [Brachionus plicatilis]|uniref:Uncharacterized protein n=1 Tax=Brachionus plicatilis TaxID=10195 RepID=A0A3M7QG23_BRAPC|nr:hypothetical protein BpHYR1_005419 [Brachionus plicatilis]
MVRKDTRLLVSDSSGTWIEASCRHSWAYVAENTCSSRLFSNIMWMESRSRSSVLMGRMRRSRVNFWMFCGVNLLSMLRTSRSSSSCSHVGFLIVYGLSTRLSAMSLSAWLIRPSMLPLHSNLSARLLDNSVLNFVAMLLVLYIA